METIAVEMIAVEKKTAPITTSGKRIVRVLATIALLFCFWCVSAGPCAVAQEKPAPAASSSSQTPPEPTAAQKPTESSSARTAAEPASSDQSKNAQSNSEHVGIARELAKETREAEGEEEEHSDLKHSSSVQWLAKKTGLSVHGAHLLAVFVDFVLVVYGIFLFLRYGIPGMIPSAFAALRKRGESIQGALEEARKASQEANKRLADIENRLRQMDVEIGQMQASAEKEAQGEEARIRQGAEQEIRKVVEAAEQEIAAAAKQARRELSNHTADLAIALARKQINVDSNTDQVLVRDFAAKLAANGGQGNTRQDNKGKDGR